MEGDRGGGRKESNPDRGTRSQGRGECGRCVSITCGGRTDRTKRLSHDREVLLLFFLVVGDIKYKF